MNKPCTVTHFTCIGSRALALSLSLSHTHTHTHTRRTIKGYVFHKADATAGAPGKFFPKYDKKEYMDIAKMLLENAPRCVCVCVCVTRARARTHTHTHTHTHKPRLEQLFHT
jgi:hypothetical protein